MTWIPTAILVAASFCLSGCLTCEEPFYKDEDLFQDDRIVGTYSSQSKEDPESYCVVQERPVGTARKGHYLIVFHEGTTASISFDAALFKVGTKSFLDLTLAAQSGSVRNPGGPPGTIEILSAILPKPYHLLVSVKLTEKGLGCSFTKRGNLIALFNAAHARWEQIEWEGADIARLKMKTPEARKLLEHALTDAVFPTPTNFAKAKPLTK
jgi:hypothetical protein